MCALYLPDSVGTLTTVSTELARQQKPRDETTEPAQRGCWDPAKFSSQQKLGLPSTSLKYRPAALGPKYIKPKPRPAGAGTVAQMLLQPRPGVAGTSADKPKTRPVVTGTKSGSTMKRKKEDSPDTRIWTYGCPYTLKPEHVPEIHEQLQLSHNYYNALIAVEAKRLQDFRLAREKQIASYEELNRAIQGILDQLTEARQAIKDARKESRSRVAPLHDVKALKTHLALAKARLRSAKKDHTASIKPFHKEFSRRVQVLLDQSGQKGPKPREKANAQIYQEMLEDPSVPDNWKELAKIDAEALAARKALRNNRGDLGPTYQLVERAVDASVSSVLRGKSGELKPRRWSPGGTVGIQVRNLPPEQLFAGSNEKFRIDPVPADTYSKNKGHKRKSCKTHAHLQLFTRAQDKPATRFPVTLHRPLPADAVVKWAWVKVTKVGLDFRYELQLTLEAHSFRKPVDPNLSNCVVAINLGWRDRGDYRRVGMCVDNSGKSWELALPGEIETALQKCEELQSIRKKLFNETLQEVMTLFKSEAAPAWAKEFTEHMHLWKREGRLMHFLKVWGEQRFPGDEALWSKLHKPWDPIGKKAGWVDDSKHLYQWESHQRDKTISRRKDLYRNIVSDLGLRYGKILLGDVDYADLAELAPPEEKNALELPARHARVMSSVSLLNNLIKERAHEVLEDSNFTKTCSKCGHLHAERPAKLVHACEECAFEEDQDIRYAKNLLMRYYGAAPPKAAAA